MRPLDTLPDIFFATVWGITIWQLIAIAALMIAGWLVARLIAPAILSVLQRGVSRTAVAWDDEMIASLSVPLKLGLWAAFLFVTVPWLELADPAQPSLQVIWRLAAVIVLGSLLSSWVRVWGKVLERSAAGQTDEVIRSFVPIFVRAANVAVWAVVLVVVLDAAGIEVMGLVAGLGIGGLAVAFAAKETIANLFGSLAIASDRPFGVGDFIKVGSTSGTVEEVGLRSTRLRTSARTLVTIPNGDLMTERIENFAARDRRLFETTVALSLESTSAQLQYVIDELKKLLSAHPKVYHEVVRVRLAGFAESAINISVFTWFVTDDFDEYQAMVEEVNFAILDILSDAGTGLALPSRTVYSSSAPGSNSERAAEIATEVDRRRSAGELWIPNAPT